MYFGCLLGQRGVAAGTRQPARLADGSGRPPPPVPTAFALEPPGEPRRSIEAAFLVVLRYLDLQTRHGLVVEPFDIPPNPVGTDTSIVSVAEVRRSDLSSAEEVDTPVPHVLVFPRRL